MHQHNFNVQVYYEDTDHSGVVYHSNYLKYFERAREDVIGIDTLKKLWHEEGIGFAVYKLTVNYREGAVFGDKLEIRSTWINESEYRTVWKQEAWRENGSKAAVSAEIELVCLDRNKKLIPIKDFI